MQIDGVSTLVMSNLLKDTIHRTQRDLTESQVEYSTGRHADVGLALGAVTGRDLTMRAQLTELQSLTSGNELAGTRLELAQSTLSAIRDAADTFLQTLTGARGASDGQATAKAAAEAALATLTGLLNTTFGGNYLFGGIASDQKPIADYPGSPAGAAKASVDAAFFAAFGMQQSSPGVSGIPASSMQSFLDNQFAAMFEPPQWQADWSQASDTTRMTRIDTGQRVDSGLSANAAPYRTLVQAFTMVLDLGEGQLNAMAFQTVVDQAMTLAGNGILGIGNEQARLGISQNQITAASDRIALRLKALTGDSQTVEGVDPYEAATRTNTLQTQLEASYTLTGRISKLSILNYI